MLLRCVKYDDVREEESVVESDEVLNDCYLGRGVSISALIEGRHRAPLTEEVTETDERT
jgi:hypothetical protein